MATYHNNSVLRGINIQDLTVLRQIMAALNHSFTHDTMDSHAPEIAVLNSASLMVVLSITSYIRNNPGYPLLRDAITRFTTAMYSDDRTVSNAAHELATLATEAVFANPDVNTEAYETARESLGNNGIVFPLPITQLREVSLHLAYPLGNILKLLSLTMIINRPATRSQIRWIETRDITHRTLLGLARQPWALLTPIATVLMATNHHPTKALFGQTHQPLTFLTPIPTDLMALGTRCTTNHPMPTLSIFNKTATQAL